GSVVEALARFSTVLVYDRAGVGRSDIANDRRTIDLLAADLHAMIELIPAQRPAVIVGWSLTGLSALLHAFEYPEDVLGLVLVDPTPHTLYSDPQSKRLAPNFKRQLRLQRLLSRLGFGRLWGRNAMRDFLVKHSGQITDNAVLARYADSLRGLASAPASRELESLPESCEIAAGRMGGEFPDVPLIVLSATINSANPPLINETLVEAHRAMALLSPLGEFRPVDGASHMMTLDRPDAIVSAVRDILEKQSANS
ncbi:MAG: alpha/beta hydrolase, partial [Gimesia chilikensis]